MVATAGALLALAQALLASVLAAALAYGDTANRRAAGAAASSGSAVRPWLLPEPRVRYATAVCSGRKPARA